MGDRLDDSPSSICNVNMLDETVPEGPDESANKLVRKCTSRISDSEPKNHLDIASIF